MAKKKKSLNEFNSWGVHTKAPVYKISVAQNYVANADGKLKQDYFRQKAEETETMYQKLRLVADLDKIQPLLERVFMDLTNMRNMLDHACDDIIATPKQKKTMLEIRDMFDNFNSTIFKEIIPKLDSLAMTEGAYSKFENED